VKNDLASSCLSICLSVRLEQLGSHWTEFHEIWYLIVSRKSVETVKVALKPTKNNGHLTCRPIYMFGNTWPMSLWNEKCFRQNCRENQNKTACIVVVVLCVLL